VALQSIPNSNSVQQGEIYVLYLPSILIAIKAHKWPGAYYTLEIVNGFMTMDTIHGGDGKRPPGRGRKVQFEEAFLGVPYKKSTVDKAYVTFKKYQSSLLLRHYLDMGAHTNATWAKFDRATKVRL